MNNIFISIEALDTRKSASILSIGAAFFTPYSVVRVFALDIDLASCLSRGLTVEARCLQYWKDKLEAEFPLKGTSLDHALLELSAFACTWTDTKVWYDETDPGLAILANAYAALGMAVPWRDWNIRCYNTLRDSAAGRVAQRNPSIHGLVDDVAITGATNIIAIQNYQEICYAARKERDCQVPQQA